MNWCDKRIRIMYVTSNAPVDFTTSSASYSLPNWLSKHCNLTLVCPAASRSRRIPFEKDLEKIINIDRNSWRALAVARSLVRMVLHDQYDMIITDINESSLLLGIYASFKTNCIHITVCNDHPFQSRYHVRKGLLRVAEQAIRTKLLQNLLRRPSKILCFIEEEVLNFLKIPNGRIIQMRNGVDDSLLSLRENNTPIDPFSIGYIGAVEDAKGSLDMLDVFVRVKRETPKATLTLIGSFVSEEERLIFERRCRELEIHEGVEVTGYKEHQEALRLLQKFAVCLHAYHPEPWLFYNQVLKIGEYMAIGKAVVSWDYPGARRLLDHGMAGILVKPKDLNLMADKITKIFKDSKLRKELEINAYEKASKSLIWSRIGQEVLETMRATLSKHINKRNN